MTQFLPPNLLALFAPRDPIPYLPPLDKLPFEKKNSSYSGVGVYLSLFEDPKDTPDAVKVESKDERLERKRREKAEQIAYKLEQGIALWEPMNNPNATSDPFKTLFVARINYDSTESKLRREFETYGPVRKINVVHNRENGKPRGYAFIEYEHERDMHSAYKHADGKKIDGRRVLVDVERARTVKGWLPRRLGGGLGGTRRGGPDVNVKHSGREELRSAVVGVGGEEREGREPRRRSRSRTPIQRERPERRRRSRSRSRDRERRRERKRRSSHERSRDKDRDRDGNGVPEEVVADAVEVEDRKDRIEKRRSRSRDRGERERKRSKRSRERSDRKQRRDRGSERDRGDRRTDREAYGDKPIQIKEEPIDDGYENNDNGGGDSGDPDGANENDDSYGYSGSQYDEYSRDGANNDAGQYNSYYSATTGIKVEPPE